MSSVAEVNLWTRSEHSSALGLLQIAPCFTRKGRLLIGRSLFQVGASRSPVLFAAYHSVVRRICGWVEVVVENFFIAIVSI